jgi:hypothetical protein
MLNRIRKKQNEMVLKQDNNTTKKYLNQTKKVKKWIAKQNLSGIKNQ